MRWTKNKKEYRVLLVEDDEGHAKLVANAFNGHTGQFQLDVVGSLKEVDNYLKKVEPDLVIADVVLPDGRGTELLGKEGDEVKYPVIIMTSYGDEQMAVEVLKAGASDYIVKMESVLKDMPFIALRVLREWDHIIGRKKAELLHTILYNISKVANSDVSMDELFQSIHQNVGQIMDADNFYIALYDQDSELISLPYFIDEIDEYTGPYPFGKGLTERILLTGEPLLITDEEHRELAHKESLEIVGAPSRIWLGVPLKSGQKTFGALVVQHYTNDDAYSEKDMEMLMFVSDQVAAVIRRRQAEQALKDSERKYRMLFDSMMDAFAFYEAIYDKDGRFIDYKYLEINHMYEHIIGLKREQVIGKSVKELFPGNAQDWFDIYSKVAETGDPVKCEYFHEAGNRYYEVNTYRPEPDTFACVFSDITQRKEAEREKQELEEKIITLKKMEAIGRLASGVAHDLNNVLSAIVSYPDLLLMRIPEDSKLRRPIITMQQSGQKAAAIVQDLLSLARRGVSVREVVDLRDVLTNYLLSPEFEKLRKYHPGLTARTYLAEDVLNIEGSFVHLNKIVMNLVSNAAEAMPNGGEIVISLENRYVDTELAGYDLSIKEGDYVVLTVSDCGVGISSEDIKKIFEPFYTKKEMGRSGTGLGMTVVWGTVKDHGGYINVDSSKHKGTTFEVFLPASRKAVVKENNGLVIEDYVGKGEKILVIDDIQEQREIASEMLKTLGYTVETVPSGEMAIEYIERQEKVDLLLLDMIMEPGMDGLDTYRAILNRAPGTKAIIASGFSETQRVREAQHLGAGAYIRKPYTLEKIGTAVKRELTE